MPFVNKEILLSDFLKSLRKRIESSGNTGALIYFETYLEDGLIEAVKERSISWNGLCNAGDFDRIYPIAVKIIREAAGRNLSEAHPDTYQQAHAVSVAFCEELNETFQCSGDDKFDLIPIKSFVSMAVETGSVRVEDDGSVQLTPKGEEMARETEAGIKSRQN